MRQFLSELEMRDNAPTKLFCDYRKQNQFSQKSSHACKDKTYKIRTSLYQGSDSSMRPRSYVYFNWKSSDGFTN